MLDTKCSQYWLKSDYLPADTILDYWCEGRGDECRTAKKFALIAACEREEIEYTRSDGKDFKDPVELLIGSGVLLIKRESFESWLDGWESIPVSPSKLQNSVKVENNLLKIVLAMAIDCYGYDPENERNTATSDIIKALESIGLSVSENTVRARLKEAAEMLPRDKFM